MIGESFLRLRQAARRQRHESCGASIECVFADREAAKKAVVWGQLKSATRRFATEFAEMHRDADEVHRASIVRRQSKLLIELIDKRIERALFVKKALRPRPFAHAIRHLLDLIQRTGPAALQKGDHRHVLMLQPESLEFELAAAIFENLHSGFEVLAGQQPSPDSFDADQPIADAATAHRLSEDAE